MDPTCNPRELVKPTVADRSAIAKVYGGEVITDGHGFEIVGPGYFDTNDSCFIEFSEISDAIDQWEAGKIDLALLDEVVNAWESNRNVCQTGATSVERLRLQGVQASMPASRDRLTIAARGHGIASIGVDVYDSSGQHVVSRTATGSQLKWRLRNGEGQPVANGVYLYRVTVHGVDGQVKRSQVKKLVVMR